MSNKFNLSEPSLQLLTRNAFEVAQPVNALVCLKLLRVWYFVDKEVKP